MPAAGPVQSPQYLHVGAGQRIQQVAASGGDATTSYIGNLEEVTSSGGTTTTTAYYGGLAESVNGALSYLLSDGLGSVSEAVSTTTGAVSATQLYSPYGAVRNQSGTLPTSKCYTGQRSDTSTSGLDYYNARYYDAVAGQFTSTDPLGSPAVSMMRPAPDRTPASVEAPLGTLEPDSATAAKRDSTEANAHVDASHSTASTNRTSARPASPRDGLNLYVYVKGNPESFTDPTGMFTVGLCVSAGGGAGIGGFVQACAVVGWSSDAGVSGGLTLTGGAHAYAGIGGGVAVGIQGSTASRVDDLGGPFTYLGAGGNLPPPLPIGVDGDIFTGRDGRGRPIFGGDGQLSAGGGYHVFGGESGTQVITFHDPTYSDGGRYARQLQQYVHQQVQSWIRQFLGWPRVP